MDPHCGIMLPEAGEDMMVKKNYPHISVKAIFYTLRVYCEAVGPRVVFFAFYRICNSILPSIAAILTGNVVTRVAEAISTHDIFPALRIILVLLFLQLINIVLTNINQYLSARTNQDVYIYVREHISTKYLQIPLRMREKREFADKFDRVKDFAISVPLVTSNIIGMITAMISFISVFVAMLTISPVLTLIVALSTIPSSIISLRLSASHRRNWREYTKERRIAWGIENKILNSNSALELELNNLGNYLVKRMVKASRKSQEQDVKDTRKYLWPYLGSNLLETITTYGVLTYVTAEIIFGKLDIGQFFTVRTLLLQLSSNITVFLNNLATVSENLVNATDYMEFMEIPPRNNGGFKIQNIPTIEFEGVSFSYPNTSAKALDNVSFKICPGESLAIVGENGAGKTTLIKLLIGAYEPSEGVILVDGRPFSEIDRESYLSNIGALFQEYSRYEFATLGENVWFGDVSKKYHKKAIEAALEQADLAKLSSAYKKGLDQVLSKDFEDKATADLSGGQWQRLAIARVLYRSPNILLLDEPTSAIDAKSENKIFHNIFESQKGKSTIIISHRFSTVRRATKIIVLDHGKIIESGNHDQLVAKQHGVYKTLFEAQAKGYR